MTYDVLWQSSLANIGLVFAYVAYKFCSRVAASKCHYSRDHGLSLDLPDPEEAMDVDAINKIFQTRGMSMRIRGTA